MSGYRHFKRMSVCHKDSSFISQLLETSLNLVGSVVENLNQTPVAPAEEEDAINFFTYIIESMGL